MYACRLYSSWGHQDDQDMCSCLLRPNRRLASPTPMTTEKHIYGMWLTTKTQGRLGSPEGNGWICVSYINADLTNKNTTTCIVFSCSLSFFLLFIVVFHTYILISHNNIDMMAGTVASRMVPQPVVGYLAILIYLIPKRARTSSHLGQISLRLLVTLDNTLDKAAQTSSRKAHA